MKLTAVVAFAGLLCTTAVVTGVQDAPPSKKTGANIGAKAPAFQLKDQAGKPQTLDDLSRDADYVALVFYRSADW